MSTSTTVKINIPAGDGFPEINATFRKPTLEELSIIWSNQAKGEDSLKSAIALLRTVFVEGDEWIFEDAILLGEISSQLNDIINGYPVLIKEEWNTQRLIMEYEITIEVEKESLTNPKFKIRRPNIDHLSSYNQYIESNPIIATRELYKATWVEGDQKILEDNDLLISAVGALSKIMRRRENSIVKTWLR